MIVCMGAEPERDYRVSLAELERDAHVPLENQVTGQAEAPAESPVSPDRLNRLRAISIAHDGRW
jgi:hypothetical protein